MSRINHTLFKVSRFSKLKDLSMIRVSRNIPGTSPPFETKCLAFNPNNNHNRSNRQRKNVVNLNNTNTSYNRTLDNVKHNNINDSIATTPNGNNKIYRNNKCHQMNNNNNHAVNTTRTSPSLLINNKYSDNSDHSDNEITLFAGSKSYVTPSPSELPKPPEKWITNLNNCNTNVNTINSNNNIVFNKNGCLDSKMTKVQVNGYSSNMLDNLKESDSAILVIGGKQESSSNRVKKTIK